MKLKNLFSVGTCCILLASCSNDEPANNGNNNGVETQGTSYLTLKIDLPTSRSSRAVSLTDGLESEYKVNNGKLLVWKAAGTTEDEYTFVESADLGNLNPWDKNPSEDITTEATAVAELKNKFISGATYYALVLLNTADDFAMPSTGDTYSTWNAANEGVDFTSNGFYMANAPEYKGGNITTLVKIDSDNVYTSEAAANAGDVAVEVYVERGVAKVTLDTPSVTEIKGGVFDGDKVSINGWSLDVTNKSTFPVHKFAGLTEKWSGIWSDARMIGGTDFKRIYWGIDPNYNTLSQSSEDDIDTDFNRASTYSSKFGDGNPQYCLENTFDIEHMLQGQTTRVVFKAQFTPDGFNTGDSYFMVKNSVYNQTTLENNITTYALAALDIKLIEGQESPIEFSFGTLEAGKIELTKDMFSVTEGSEVTITDETIEAINNELNGDILFYNGGECYYVARIRHFDDDETTAWNPGDETYGENDATQNAKYLGRYSVLRNNWYSLSVSAVTAPGYPVNPPINPTTPDDENKFYIKTVCRVLSWAKRVQNITL